MEPVYGTVIALVRTVWRVQGLRFTVIGQEHIPATGGAVVGDEVRIELTVEAIAQKAS